ncbi:hypothetical protein, partial [Actinacidiphila sp. bgisy167]|uniref:hypothetical protein n=1 Tax=Actinacidiphila sp. bgisy167 TaxID=3413797 RepID=UPI003D75BC0E
MSVVGLLIGVLTAVTGRLAEHAMTAALWPSFGSRRVGRGLSVADPFLADLAPAFAQGQAAIQVHRHGAVSDPGSDDASGGRTRGAA